MCWIGFIPWGLMNCLSPKPTPLALKCIRVSLKQKMFASEEKFVERKVQCFTLRHFSFSLKGQVILHDCFIMCSVALRRVLSSQGRSNEKLYRLHYGEKMWFWRLTTLGTKGQDLSLCCISFDVCHMFGRTLKHFPLLSYCFKSHHRHFLERRLGTHPDILCPLESIRDTLILNTVFLIHSFICGSLPQYQHCPPHIDLLICFLSPSLTNTWQCLDFTWVGWWYIWGSILALIN